MRLFASVVFVAFLTGCGSAPEESATARPRVVMFNQNAADVMVFRDADALQSFIDTIKNPSHANQAQLKAAEVDGKLFRVANGTRAYILKSVPVPSVPDTYLLRIRIRNGPHETEEGMCFSDATQPDTGPA